MSSPAGRRAGTPASATPQSLADLHAPAAGPPRSPAPTPSSWRRLVGRPAADPGPADAYYRRVAHDVMHDPQISKRAKLGLAVRRLVRGDEAALRGLAGRTLDKMVKHVQRPAGDVEPRISDHKLRKLKYHVNAFAGGNKLSEAYGRARQLQHEATALRAAPFYLLQDEDAYHRRLRAARGSSDRTLLHQRLAALPPALPALRA